ncbi:hypothetical protein [Candidatus Vondammii sp. HM_W22]|uniref:hypothetical protein n=1 Tax=Candidatus Vondammii sp. HM_W22 TaxID=2687299 RepID=UPI001F12CB89|nr:hypothetical protein [Candidatus Vondammii sp. HM_W22]
MSKTLDQDVALALLRLFKKRTGQKHSWREVQRAMAETGHEYVLLASSQKLANWNNRKRNSRLETRAFEAVKHFIRSPKFQRVVPEANRFLHQSQRSIEAGELITELAGIYPLEKTEEVMFKALEGFWFYRQNRVSLYIHRVPEQNFCITHLCQKVFDCDGAPAFYENPRFFKFYASGFLYFGNTTHSKNAEHEDLKAINIGRIKERPYKNEEYVGYDINVDGKQLILKIWDIQTRNEANLNLTCESEFERDGFEPSYDRSCLISPYFRFIFQTEETCYEFKKANYTDGYFWSNDSAKEMGDMKKEFYNMKWSVLPNGID